MNEVTGTTIEITISQYSNGEKIYSMTTSDDFLPTYKENLQPYWPGLEVFSDQEAMKSPVTIYWLKEFF